MLANKKIKNKYLGKKGIRHNLFLKRKADIILLMKHFRRYQVNSDGLNGHRRSTSSGEHKIMGKSFIYLGTVGGDGDENQF